MHGLCRAATRSPEAKLEPHWNHERPARQRRKPPLRAAFGVLVGLLQGFLQPYATVGLDSGGGIRTRDLRVMSPTSYQTAPPRGGPSMIASLGACAIARNAPNDAGLRGVRGGVLVAALLRRAGVVALVVDVGVERRSVVVDHLRVVGRVRGLGVAQ